MKIKGIGATAVLIASIAMMIFGPTGTASAATGNTLQVDVLPGKGSATIFVYGPNGYYRSSDVGASTTSFQRRTYTGAPYGDYRVRVHWNVNSREDNYYGYPFPSYRRDGNCKRLWFVYDGNRGGPDGC